jgi:5-methylcytosine-specific restriction endonuclease McrA
MNRTPRSRIKGMLRQIFLKSTERANALKKTQYKCSKCGMKASVKKGSEVKLEVDHIEGINIWNELISLIEDELLCVGSPEKLQPLCRECHQKKTNGEL